MLATCTFVLLGCAQGLRHALEPDHLAAMVALLAEGRAHPRHALAWGGGHGLSLVLVGGLLCALRPALPAWLFDVLELASATMLVILGLRALRRLRARTRPTTGPGAPAAVGLVHGLSGSGALAAVAMARADSVPLAFLFLALYACGAALGMALFAAIAGGALGRSARDAAARVPRWSAALATLVGLAWAAPVVARLWS